MYVPNLLSIHLKDLLEGDAASFARIGSLPKSLKVLEKVWVPFQRLFEQLVDLSCFSV